MIGSCASWTSSVGQFMKILFLNRFFFPDTSATSQIVSDLAFHLAREGYEVHAITSSVGGREARHQRINGVTIHRVANALGRPPGLLRRAPAYLEYYRRARPGAP